VEGAANTDGTYTSRTVIKEGLGEMLPIPEKKKRENRGPGLAGRGRKGGRRGSEGSAKSVRRPGDTVKLPRPNALAGANQDGKKKGP